MPRSTPAPPRPPSRRRGYGLGKRNDMNVVASSGFGHIDVNLWPRCLMATNVSLTPELERFARDCVAEGRYNNVSEVVRAALRLLQDWEQERQRFTASLRDAEEEADREGWLTVEEVRAEAQ